MIYFIIWLPVSRYFWDSDQRRCDFFRHLFFLSFLLLLLRIQFIASFLLLKLWRLRVGTATPVSPTPQKPPPGFFIIRPVLRRRRVCLTKRSLFHWKRSPIHSSLSDRLYFHKESRSLRTGYMESRVTVGLVALNGCSATFLLTQVTC